jgi:adenylate kinase
MTPLVNDRASWLHGPPAKCSAPPDRQAGWRLVLLGPPGVGKGTQAELLAARLCACHLSTGDVFRAAGKNTLSTTPAMSSALEFMRRGELVPDITVWELVRERSACLLECGSFILDGFPRTVNQAQLLKEFLDQGDTALTGVIDYELPLQEIVRRLSGRRTCEICAAVYNLAERPPKIHGVCDHCGGRLFQREDDRPESIQVRLGAYHRSTAPLIQFYRDLGLLVPVHAGGSPHEILERTLQQLAGLPVAGAI